MLTKLLSQKALLNTLLVAVFLGGVFSYFKLGKLEDAEIAVKSAVVVAIYPGATAHEVELEVTDVLEKAIQKLENIDNIESRSLPGMTQITVNMKGSVRSKEVPQIWDHLRRKVGDASGSLPQGVRVIVNDDFGDVYGIFAAVTAEGYQYRELYNYVDFMRRELLSVDGIKRIELFGAQTEAVEISLSAEKLAKLNLNPGLIIMALQDQGKVVNPGSISSGTDKLRLSVGNKLESVADVQEVLIQVPKGGSFRLGDIADVKMSFYEPKQEELMYNGKKAISLAISMEKGVNVITVGEKYEAKMAELKARLPIGFEVNSVFSQPERVAYSIQGFVVNLIESVLIVVIVLLFAMGMRSGLLIASGLVFTILATLIVMLIGGIQLQRISLAAIIVAMGMLVDNSIVVADGILINLKRGMDRKQAFTDPVKRTILPLLGATVIAILAFMPLAMTPDSAGEYLSSLFTVLAISLFLSWIFASVQTPFMAANFYKKGLSKKKQGDPNSDPFATPTYNKLRNMIGWVLHHKVLFLVGSFVILVLSFMNFKNVKFQFMPLLDYSQFVVEYKLPKGSDINAVEADLKKISTVIVKWDEVDNVTAATGRTPARYTLLRPIATGSPNYGELIVNCKDYETSIIAGEKIIDYLKQVYPQAQTRKRIYGPVFTEYEIQAQFSGPDPAVLRNLASQAKHIMHQEQDVVSVTDNWSNKVKVLTPAYSVDRAQKLGISRSDVANAIAVATDGMLVGAIHEGNKTLPIKLKLDGAIGDDVDRISSIPVWGKQSAASVPLGQVTDKIEFGWENNEVFRYNSKRTIRAQCDPRPGLLTADVEKKIVPAINAIQLPDGYSMEWKGSNAKSAESQGNLMGALPLALGLMLIIVIALFNNIKQAVIIFTIFPFAFVGIVFGFLSTGAVFTFIGMIGALGLIGMMIKNAIVLLDEINLNLKDGLLAREAVILAILSRVRPVFLASATTILGMMPLLWDVMFKSMAITIIFGLLIGTLITLLVVPVMYVVLFKVDTKA